MASVCAVVLTHNRKRMLVECVQALLDQSEACERVLIVDNASTDGTAQELRDRGLLDAPSVTYARLEHNRGASGGYAEALRRAQAAGTGWIWLMDDDAEPRRDALARLLAAPVASEPATAPLCTAVVHADGRLDPLHRGSMGWFMRILPPSRYRGYPRLDWASWVGIMVRSSVVDALEPPRTEFFLGCDDVEYSLRVRRHGEIRLVPESVIVHKLKIAGGSVTRRSRLWNLLLRQSYTSASWDGFWRNLYAIRNYLWIKHHREGASALAQAWITAGYVGKSLLYDRRPLRRIPWIVRFARAGRRGDFSGPTPDEWEAHVRGSS